MVLLLIKFISEIGLFRFKHIKAFILVELIPTKADQIIDKTAGFGNIDYICFSKSLQEF